MKYLEVVTYHATQIVSTADLKTHLRITFSDDDAYIAALESAAVGMVEEYTNRYMLETTVNQYGNKFSDLEILFKSPVKKSGWRAYYRKDDLWIVIDAEDIEVVYAISPSRVYATDKGSIPSVSTDDVFQAWYINYDVGYATVGDIPAALIQAIKIIVADLYENRQSVIVGKMVSEIPKTATYLMNPYRVQTL